MTFISSMVDSIANQAGLPSMSPFAFMACTTGNLVVCRELVGDEFWSSG